MKNNYKTLVISDLNLGNKQSKTKELIHFLRHVKCDTLILNGNIIDQQNFVKTKTWKKKYSRFYIRLLKLLDEHKIHLVYLPGQNDQHVFRKLPIVIGNVRIAHEHHLKSANKRFLVRPGSFAYTSLRWQWLTYFGKIGFLLLDKIHQTSYLQGGKNKLLTRNFFERCMVQLARNKGFDGIICGQLGSPEIKEIGQTTYLNSGDWMEKLSALAETYNGKWHLIYYGESGKKKNKAKSEQANSLKDIHQEVS